jgi:hypothetical protein
VKETGGEDFLKKDVKTLLSASYIAAGVRLRLETNSDTVLGAARQIFEEAPSGLSADGEIRLRLWVEGGAKSDAPHARPYFRGLGDLVFCSFDDRSALLVNVRDRSGAGRLTEALSRDPRFWKIILFPSFLTVVGPAAGLTSIHCACVAWKGDGLLLAGESGSGKSCLSLALAQAGFDFLSDDRTLIGDRGGSLTAWGLPGEMKQRFEAAAFFPGLGEVERLHAWDERPVFRFDPSELFGVGRVSSCKPRWIVFLEQQPEASFFLDRIAPEDAARRLAKDMHRQPADVSRRQERTVGALLGGECCRLRYGGSPHAAADALRDLVVKSLRSKAAVSASTPADRPQAEVPRCDPLRRFRATSLSSDIHLMGKTVRFETDDPGLMESVTANFRAPDDAPGGSPQFLWRIVCDADDASDRVWPLRTGFSDRSSRFVNLGRRGFIAADLAAREAVGRLPEQLALDRDGFASVFLASMLHLSAPALGLVAVSAACVASGDSGLLIFGRAGSGKTSSSYWANRYGLEFVSDQAVFLENDAGQVYAWGDFWPAAFRPETARYFPELSSMGRRFQYRDRTFLCIDKPGNSPRSRQRVIPAACILLKRSAPAPRVTPLEDIDRSAIVLSQAGSQEERRAASRLLQGIPAYRLSYGDDPSVAAVCFRSVLAAHRLMEARP